MYPIKHCIVNEEIQYKDPTTTVVKIQMWSSDDELHHEKTAEILEKIRKLVDEMESQK